jgi:uncharacterized protein YunC (DUF1805 family)
MPNITQIISRLVAVFIASAIPNVGVGAMLDVDAGKAMVMSGAIAVLGVVQQLAVAVRDKGTITQDDLDKAVHSQGD